MWLNTVPKSPHVVICCPIISSCGHTCPNISSCSHIQLQNKLNICVKTRVRNSLFLSFDLRSFAPNHSYKRAAVSDLLSLIFKKEQLWANFFRLSLQKSDCEWFAQVAHDKRVTGAIHSFSRANSSFSLWLTKNERFAQKPNERIPNSGKNRAYKGKSWFCDICLAFVPGLLHLFHPSFTVLMKFQWRFPVACLKLNGLPFLIVIFVFFTKKGRKKNIRAITKLNDVQLNFVKLLKIWYRLS